jgi:hypothetical protein
VGEPIKVLEGEAEKDGKEGLVKYLALIFFVASIIVISLLEGFHFADEIVTILKLFREHFTDVWEILLTLSILAAGSSAISVLVIILMTASISTKSGLQAKVDLLQSQVQLLSNQVGPLRDGVDGLTTERAKLYQLGAAIDEGVKRIHEFISIAPEVAGPDRMALLKTSLLMLPEEYTRVITDLTNADAPPSRLVLVGSMVGFTYTLVSELARSAGPARGSLKELHVIGPMVPVPQSGRPGNLVAPVWNFEMLFFRQLISDFDLSHMQGEWQFEFKSTYLPFDSLGAAILVPDEFVIALQALSPEMLEQVARNRAHVVGMKYCNSGSGDSVFRRFEQAIGAYQEHPGVCSDVKTIRISRHGLQVSTTGLVLPMHGGKQPRLEIAMAKKIAECDPCVAAKSYQIKAAEFVDGKRELLFQIELGIKDLQGRYDSVDRINRVLRAAGVAYVPRWRKVTAGEGDAAPN